MAKKKLQRFSEMLTFGNVFQPLLTEVIQNGFILKNKWNEKYFKNNNPIILELGCGKGEYTIELSRIFKNNNFIGIDIKGARMWKGAKIANDNSYSNVAFLRTRVEFLEHFFGSDEVSEIWLTFPDPFMKKKMSKRRLTSPQFLNLYSKILKDDGIIHLKTDNNILYNYTLNLLKTNKMKVNVKTNNLYGSKKINKYLSIKTFYENKFLAENRNICYLAFKLSKRKIITGNQEIDEK